MNDLDRTIFTALALHQHACTVGCRLADGGDCNADGLSDADHFAAARLVHELDQLSCSDLPEGQQSKEHDCEEIDRLVWHELATMTEVARSNKRHVQYMAEENEQLRAEVAQVRADAWAAARRVVESAQVDSSGPGGVAIRYFHRALVGGMCIAEEMALMGREALERLHAPAESVVGALPDQAGTRETAAIVRGYVVDAAARALYRWVWDEDHDDCWNRLEPAEADTYRDQARVVLEAAAVRSAEDAR